MTMTCSPAHYVHLKQCAGGLLYACCIFKMFIVHGLINPAFRGIIKLWRKVIAMGEQGFEGLHEKNLQRLKNFRLMDDDFMAKVFEDKVCAKLLLRIILVRDDLQVKEVHGQYAISNLQGRSVRLDIFATDSTGKVYNIEVQRDDRGAVARRARYNAALIDANITEPGEDYQALNECYVIFITENDVLGGGLPIYHIGRMIQETQTPFDDGQHILYVNARIQDETALGRLMHDMWCCKAEQMHYDVLADRVKYFKEDVEGVKTMCRAMEELWNEATEQAKFKARVEAVLAIMKKTGWTKEKTMEMLDIPKNEYPKYLSYLGAY